MDGSSPRPSAAPPTSNPQGGTRLGTEEDQASRLARTPFLAVTRRVVRAERVAARGEILWEERGSVTAAPRRGACELRLRQMYRFKDSKHRLPLQAAKQQTGLIYRLDSRSVGRSVSVGRRVGSWLFDWLIGLGGKRGFICTSHNNNVQAYEHGGQDG